ncbi:MAG: GIY-YIG nuclease family protein [Firmicutes bacterium]|nr:GIY-YIG nuclease family protein [Bacillota bacterium]
MCDLDARWWVYCLQCADGSYYIGIATDVCRRYRAHQAGKGARYTRAKPPVRLVGVRGPFTRSEALRQEAWHKRRPHRAKAALWEGAVPLPSEAKGGG